MILADTSVWVEHFRGKNSQLSAYLQHGEVWTHPFVIGELACGNLPQRKQTLHLLTLLPNVTLAEHGEVLTFLNTYSLQGIGLSWIDIHTYSHLGSNFTHAALDA